MEECRGSGKPYPCSLRGAKIPDAWELPVLEHDSEQAVMLHATVHHRPVVNGVSGF
jgi:hypothetical protein